MACLRLVMLFALVAAALAAPAVREMAAPEARSHHEEAELEQTDAGGEASGAGDVDAEVSVSTSTSMEITTVESSVSSEIRPMPVQPDEQQKATNVLEEDISTNEIEDELSGSTVSAEVKEHFKADAEVQTVTESEVQPNAEVEAETDGKVEAETNAEVEAETDTEVQTVAETQDVTSKPTLVPDTVEVATSVSTQMTEMTMSVSSEVGDVQQTDSEEAVQAEDVTAASFDDAPEEEEDEEEESEVEFEVEGSGDDFESRLLDTGVEGSGYESAEEANEMEEESHSADQDGSGAEQDSTTKGTLIFDLGPEATPELHDLVQQTVLDALMDEGLLATAEVNPVFQVEGSGVVFSDDVVEASGVSADDGSGASEESGEDNSTSPFVSIHF